MKAAREREAQREARERDGRRAIAADSAGSSKKKPGAQSIFMRVAFIAIVYKQSHSTISTKAIALVLYAESSRVGHKENTSSRENMAM